MARRTVAALLVSSMLAGCTPLAVGGVIVGGASTAAGAHAAGKSCDSEGCAYGQALGIMLVVIGLVMLGGGGAYLVAEER